MILNECLFKAVTPEHRLTLISSSIASVFYSFSGHQLYCIPAQTLIDTPDVVVEEMIARNLWCVFNLGEFKYYIIRHHASDSIFDNTQMD